MLFQTAAAAAPSSAAFFSVSIGKMCFSSHSALQRGSGNGGDQPCVQICVALLSIRVPVGTAHLGEAPQG